jgi:hypothetical protein
MRNWLGFPSEGVPGVFLRRSHGLFRGSFLIPCRGFANEEFEWMPMTGPDGENGKL